MARCSGCGHIIYEGATLYGLVEISNKNKGRCPKCRKVLEHNYRRIVISPANLEDIPKGPNQPWIQKEIDRIHMNPGLSPNAMFKYLFPYRSVLEITLKLYELNLMTDEKKVEVD